MPFLRLVQHFLIRLVRGDDSASVEIRLGAGPLLGLLAAPGAFQALLLTEKYSSLLNWIRGLRAQDFLATSVSDKYMFLSIAMAIAGIVTVLKWDRILPDSQDYINLAPLPVSLRTILFANASAIAITAAVLAITVNGASTILFPLLVVSAAPAGSIAALPFLVVHGLCVGLATFFAFCAVLAVLGTAAAILPRSLFQAWSPWIRAALLVGFIALLLSGFAGPALLYELRMLPGEPGRWLPPLWFLSLYQSLQHRATPQMIPLVPMAGWSVAAVFLLMSVSYGLSYRRRFAAVLEQSPRPVGRFAPRFLLAFLDWFAPGDEGFERASYRFIVRALLQSETQRLCLSLAIGLGWLFAGQTAAAYLFGPHTAEPTVSVLSAPLIVIYLLLVGTRAAFELPISVPANWIFRSIVDPREQESLGIARRVMLALTGLVVLLPAFTLTAGWIGFQFALVQGLCLAAFSVCLAEVLLAGYRKLPFTCVMPEFRESLPVVCLLHVIGFVAFTQVGAWLELWILRAPPRMILLFALMLGGWFANRARLRWASEEGELEPGISFDPPVTSAVETLRISDAD